MKETENKWHCYGTQWQAVGEEVLGPGAAPRYSLPPVCGETVEGSGQRWAGVPQGQGLWQELPISENTALFSSWPDTHVKQLEKHLRRSIITHLCTRHRQCMSLLPLSLCSSQSKPLTVSWNVQLFHASGPLFSLSPRRPTNIAA